MRKRKMRYICAMLFMICCISDMRVNAQEDKIYYVRQDGTGDFTSIQDGVNQVEDGAVLIITPGVYNESVTVTDKTIRLIGTNREKCIIMASAENYHNIPLTIGAGMVSNLTIYGRNLSGEYIQSVSLNENTVYEWQDTFPGYAIHIDQDYSYGRELIIDNCKVISDSNQCIGIGSRGKSTIQISNSELIANGQGGCIYLHNNSNPELDGDAQFIMKNCRLTNYKCPYIMALPPIIFIIDKLSGFLLKLLHIDSSKRAMMTETELKTYVDVSHEDGVIEQEEKKLIYNVFDFSDSVAKDIMIPRIDMTTIDVEASYNELLTLFKESMYTRIPVYEDDSDNIIGIINVKDFLLVSNKRMFKIRDIMREAYYTYEYKKTADLLLEMRNITANVALVLNEYGATVGMITLEDLLEEIVGEIRDEYDQELR